MNIQAALVTAVNQPIRVEELEPPRAGEVLVRLPQINEAFAAMPSGEIVFE